MPRRQFPQYPEKKHRSGQARIHIAGRDIYLGKWLSKQSLAEYERLKAEWAAKVQGESSPETSVRTIGELILRFMEHADQHYRHPDGKRTNEYRDYQQTTRPMDRLYGHTDVKDFGPLALKAVRPNAIWPWSLGPGAASLSPKVIRRSRFFHGRLVGLSRLP